MHKPILGRLILVLLLLAAAVGSVTAGRAKSVEAYSTYPCKWSAAVVNYRAVTPPSPRPPVPAEADQGAAAWNVTNKLRFVKAAGSGYNLSVTWNVYGNTGWTGVYTDSSLSLNWPACTSGHWVNKAPWIYSNLTYVGTYASSWEKGVFDHEFGHPAGLLHNNSTSANACPSGSGANALMYYSDARFTLPCAVYTPRTDDKNGANALYP